MANRNWNLITSGATFEELVRTLVGFEDPNAALFGRSGKDGGQDMRSGDGTRVFQAKYHEDGSAAKAIADAKKEAVKIVEYRKPGHARYEQWYGVTHWRLVTNAPFSPAEQQAWDTEVVPLFAAQGLSADYWARANLDVLLTKHPEVDRSFFRNETRAFLSLPEIHERLPFEEPFLQRTALAAFFGRENEIAQVRDFLLSDRLFLVVHGAGGMGKTRLLVEAGEEVAGEGSWQVLWANVASMASTGTWFEAIVPERPTLLLVDEPEDEQLLRLLSEQLGGRVGRAAKWKVAVAVRSPKDPVLRFLFAPRMKPRVQELPIAALSDADAEGMCNDLLNSGPLANSAEEWRKDAARELARRFSRHPIWLTLAVHVLETQEDLTQVPQTAEGLADEYLEEIVRRQQQAPSDQVLALLRWVALIGTVNRENDATVRLLGDGSEIGDETTVRKMLASLVERRALVQRGAGNRLVEVKPDVLRDHLLLSWLAVDVGYGMVRIQPSEDAKKLAASVREAVLKGNISSIGRSILISLARTELLLRLSGRPVPLLDPFFDGIRDVLESTTAGPRLVIAEVLLDMAAVRPTDTVALSRALRSSVVGSETVEGLFHSREVGQDDVTLKLAWPVFHAAMGVQAQVEREQVIEELCVLTEVEAEIATRRPGGLPNDGKRAANLVGRTLGSEPQFWSDFEDAARALAARLLERAAKEPVTSSLAAVLKALLASATALERLQVWSESEDYKFHIQSYVVLPGHPAWQTRELLLKRMKDLLADANVPLASRLVLWTLLAETHRGANYCRLQGPESLQEQMRQQLLDDLVWVHAILTARKVELEELTAARALWDWHYRFDKDLALKAASEELEALYARNDLASEFEPLFSHDTWEQRDSRTAAKAAELAAAQMPETIGAFIERAVRFLGGERELYQLLGVAWHLGQHAPTSEVVRNFVRTSLAESVAHARTEFATVVAVRWVAALRKSDGPTAAYDLVVELLKICSSDEKRMQVIQQLYGGPLLPSEIGALTQAEHDHLRSEVEDSFRALVDYRTDIDHWLGMLAARAAARQLLDGLETQADADDCVPLGATRVKYQHVRFIGVQAYVTTNWALADRITGMVGRILCTPAAGLNAVKPAELVSHFVNRDRTRTTTAATLFESVRQAFGWPIGLSYAIRNHFVHDGAQISGSDFFEGPSAASAFRISADGWNRMEEKAAAEYRVERSWHRAGANWPMLLGGHYACAGILVAVMTVGSVNTVYGAGNCISMSWKRCAISSWWAWKVVKYWPCMTELRAQPRECAELGT